MSEKNEKVPELWIDENLTTEESEERINLIFIITAFTITLILWGFLIRILIVISILDREPEVVQPATSPKGDCGKLKVILNKIGYRPLKPEG